MCVAISPSQEADAHRLARNSRCDGASCEGETRVELGRCKGLYVDLWSPKPQVNVQPLTPVAKIRSWNFILAALRRKHRSYTRAEMLNTDRRTQGYIHTTTPQSEPFPSEPLHCLNLIAWRHRGEQSL